MEAASGSAIPTKLCVLDEVSPAKGHRTQHLLALGGHPKPAIRGHLKTGQ
jgi:hypothetical protein